MKTVMASFFISAHEYYLDIFTKVYKRGRKQMKIDEKLKNYLDEISYYKIAIIKRRQNSI